MEIKTLEWFIDIAETRNYSVVADRQNISQSSLSKAIIRLEDELSVKLFDRKTHPVSLTPAGECLYAELKGLMPAYQSMMEKLGRFSNKANINISSVPKRHYIVLKYIIKRFCEENPDIKVIFHAMDQAPLTLSAITSLKKGDIDMLLIHRPLDLDEELYETRLEDDRICAVMTRDHYEKIRSSEDADDSVQISRLSGERLAETSLGRELVTELGHRYGVSFGDMLCEDNLRRDALIQMMKYEDRIMICFESDISVFDLSGYHKCYITDIEPQPFVLLERRKGRKKEHFKRFREYLLNNIYSVWE